MSGKNMTQNWIAGATIWSTLVAAFVAGWLHWSAVEILFLLGPLVVVPLGLELAHRFGYPHRRFDSAVQLPAALSVTASLFLPQGQVAAVLVLPWSIFAALLTLRAVTRFFHANQKDLKSACVLLSSLYLPVGCAWLAASRYGLNPMGFQEPIVLLTAVHFHFAGFAAPLLALAAIETLAQKAAPARFLFHTVTTGVLVGPGLLAAGFVIGPTLKLVAALTIAVSEFALAAFFLAAIPNIRPRLAQILIMLSATSVMFAMVLATIWAVGEFPLQPFVHLDEMARLHGTANALGFTSCGLLGWTIAAERSKKHAGT